MERLSKKWVKPDRQKTLFAIYFTFFLDNLSWSIIFPIFAPYFLNTETPLFSADTSFAVRTTWLGFFLMAFSLGQFLASPIIGEYADKHGRKKALLFTVFFTCIGMAVTAASIKFYSLPFLFIGRLATGIFASNASLCLTCISDLSATEKIKAQRFGFLSLLTGLSFILGALAGGKLSDGTIYSGLSPDLPFWITSAFTLINFFFIARYFQETTPIAPSLTFKFLESFHHIKQALRTKKIKTIYTVYFLFLFAWTILFQFTPVLVVHRYGFTNSHIGNLALFMGLFWATGSSALNGLLTAHLKSKKILEICLFCFTLLCGSVVFSSHLFITLAILGSTALIGGLAWPHCTTVISTTAPQEIQGKILGLTQSIQSLAMATAPLIGGISYQLLPGSAFLIASAVSLLATLIYILKKG